MEDDDMKKCECGHASSFHHDVGGAKSSGGLQKFAGNLDKMMSGGANNSKPACVYKGCACLRFTEEE